MYTMAEKQIDTVLGLVEGTEENKDEFASYRCNYVKPNGGTWYDTTSVGREDELHSAICLQGVERSRESVIRNLVQDRKCIRYQNTTSWNK